MKPPEVVAIAKKRADWIRTQDRAYAESDPILSDYLKVFDYVVERFDEGPITHDKLKALGFFADFNDGCLWRQIRKSDVAISLQFYEDVSEGWIYKMWVGILSFHVRTMKQVRDILAVWGIE